MMLEILFSQIHLKTFLLFVKFLYEKLTRLFFNNCLSQHKMNLISFTETQFSIFVSLSNFNTNSIR